MCGIAGFIDRGANRNSLEAERLVRGMTDMIAHRGPDAEGAFVDAELGVAFGHRRLSIIDISAAGAQPMTSDDGRWVISYNGEIYNFEELRQNLEQSSGPRNWRGHSDTEVLVETISAFGLRKALECANGMFALALWDRKERMLYLARDRLGEKPLYYGWQGSAFLFGSELKALTTHPDFSRRIDAASVSMYVSYGYVPHPFSVYRGIWQLKPGHYLKMAAGAPVGTAPEIVAYWSLPTPEPRAIAENEAVEHLDALLGDSVRLRMRADVPMGAFLSGGIDSSAIVGLMQAHSSNRIRSFSIGFHEGAYNEAQHAKDVARQIGTEHTELYVTPDDTRDLIPKLPQLYDEPFGDSSELPTYLLCKLTRQHVKVSLSGDGGDEIFGGYQRYFEFERRWGNRVGAIEPLRPLLAAGLNNVPLFVWRSVASVAPGRLRGKLQPHRAKRLAAAVGARSPHDFYRFMMVHWSANSLARPDIPRDAIFFDRTDVSACGDVFLGMMFVDAGSYLPDDILVKVDRASMAVSLESRIPILDHRIVEFAATLPLDLKRRGGTGKWLLRRVLDRYVPQRLIDRPKQGFGVPLEEWLRGPLKSWGEDLVNDKSTVIGELIDLASVREVWREHQRADIDHSYRLWPILMLVDWAREWRPV
jgi:asparagine synthase (glutamine-hydrolysing)